MWRACGLQGGGAGARLGHAGAPAYGRCTETCGLRLVGGRRRRGPDVASKNGTRCPSRGGRMTRRCRATRPGPTAPGTAGLGGGPDVHSLMDDLTSPYRTLVRLRPCVGYRYRRRWGQEGASIWMATGKIRADTDLIDPHPRVKTRARTRARNPPRVQNDTRTRYPRIPAYPRVRPCTHKL